jgi:hypothetical protein
MRATRRQPKTVLVGGISMNRSPRIGCDLLLAQLEGWMVAAIPLSVSLALILAHQTI